MKVLTYNIHGWRTPDGATNLGRVAEVIAASQADLVGLNEVFHPWPASEDDALMTLAARLGMGYAFGPTLAETQSPRNVPYGNALLSRWPILAYAAHRLPLTSGHEPRGLLEVRVMLPAGRPFTIYVIHLDHRSEAVRLTQWAAAQTWLSRERGRLHLVMGDFNALASSDYPTLETQAAVAHHNESREWVSPAFDLISQVLKAGYVDAFAYAGGQPGDGATWPNPQPERRIDYVLLPSAWAGDLASCRRFEHPLAGQTSDHLPVLAELHAPDKCATP
jgi:endonuclease/exonuclease/phosphatase family metal-dependent hydrolase